jgi:aspartate racemase
MMFRRTIGILGGMGPFAGAALLRSVFRVASSEYGARENHEFPRVLLASVPLVSRIQGGEEQGDAIASETSRLLQIGADVLAIACVTMHDQLGRLVALGGEWVSLVDLATDAAVAGNFRRPLVLSSRTTRQNATLLQPLRARGLDPVSLMPEDEDRLIAMLEALVAGQEAAALVPELRRLEETGIARGADSVVYGCTELSLFESTGALPTIDPLERSARELCARAVG